MANAQMPVDGNVTVTSPYGWRVHPITGFKKHHNGVDLWSPVQPAYIESAFDGRVVKVVRSVSPTGFGNSVVIQSKVLGRWVTSIYAHMVDGSLKVRAGQVVKAGTVLGKMGDTGFATGRHLHWEIWAGKRLTQPNINSGGVGFYDPLLFLKAVMAWQKANELAPKSTPQPMYPSVVDPKYVSVGKKPTLSGQLKVGSASAAVKWLQRRLKITADGRFGDQTRRAVVAFQKAHKLKADGIVGGVTWSKL